MDEVSEQPPDWVLAWDEPPGFDAYCRIFHPVWLDSDPSSRQGPEATKKALAESESALAPILNDLPAGAIVVRTGAAGNRGTEHPVKWSDLLRETSGRFDPTLNLWQLHKLGALPEALPWPNEGILDAPYLARVLEILRHHTTTPSVSAYYTCPPTFFGAPERPMWHGDISTVPDMVEQMNDYSPTYLWPDDEAWWLHTDTDSHHTTVGCTRDAVSRLVADPTLDSFAVAHEVP